MTLSFSLLRIPSSDSCLFQLFGVLQTLLSPLESVCICPLLKNRLLSRGISGDFPCSGRRVCLSWLSPTYVSVHLPKHPWAGESVEASDGEKKLIMRDFTGTFRPLERTTLSSPSCEDGQTKDPARNGTLMLIGTDHHYWSSVRRCFSLAL